MGSVVSSENEGPPDDECWCGHGRGGHSMGFCVGEVLVAGGTDRENCRCRAFAPACHGGRHCRFHNTGEPCCACGAVEPVPADAETAGDFVQCPNTYSHGPGVPVVQCARVSGHLGDHLWVIPETAGDLGAACVRRSGCPNNLTGDCQHGCREAADELTRLGEEMEPEPEAPECAHESWGERNPGPDSKGQTRISRWCTDCGEYLGRFAPTMPIEEVAMPIGPIPPRRPPNAVAYVLEDGTPFEVALPGDATVRSEDGVLIIMHSQSPVKGLVQLRPWGGA